MNRIDGKVALITGGTQGLGAAIARRLAENGAEGIITIGRSEEKGKEVAKKISEDTGCKIVFVKTDLPEVDQCRNAVKIAKKYYETEASGNVNLKTVKAIASTGVDRISVGSITHSVTAIDFKLEI